ncbi:MAG: class I SAM-dependent DNA methyltransferase, partial [Anaerolinea sp.]|nr:class I SAM-dependent DNA methyltransferase [Anaerolinea sp.]
IRVLDPACGSGNFLYVSLRLLLDLEKEIITHPLWAGLPKEDIKVHPSQLYGMEINDIAHALASVVVWIGYYQWREDNGFFHMPTPILTDMRQNIVRKDAILAYDADGKPCEPDWQPVEVIVGNPPFLGGNRIRAELGDKYVGDLFRLYEGRIGATADLVTYWFERARAQLKTDKAKRVGLLSTNSIRGGVNRQVLERIKDTGNIFMAWSDRDWVLDGAAVRVSMIGFDKGLEKARILDGATVNQINSDLTGLNVDITAAKPLPENVNLGFRGNQKGGAFDIDEATALKFIALENTSGLINRDVVKQWWNGEDLVNLPRKKWLIDFGLSTPIEEAQKYLAPFEYVREHVKPERDLNNRKAYRERWWLHAEPRPSMRRAIAPLSRYLVTPHVSKHRVFVWLTNEIVPDHQLIVVARSDDYFFGVLHSRLHELWSLRMGTWLGKGNDPRYTPTTTFETFPFPFVPGTEDFGDPRVMAISAAAKQLHEERHAWLNPPALTPRSNERTLTNLYNALQAQRGQASWKGVKAAAAEFAPRLLELHTALDRAVAAAYGWDAAMLEDDEAILRHLLALNAQRAGS